MEKDLTLIPGNLGEFLIRVAEYKLWRLFSISLLLHICGYIISFPPSNLVSGPLQFLSVASYIVTI